MLVLVLVLVLGALLSSAQAQCQAEATALVEDAAARAAEFDVAGAAGTLEAAVARGCARARVSALYMRGLVDARDAFRQGGSPESLAPVRQAIASLAGEAQNRPGSAEIARLMLQAAAAAAQSEREEMRLYLESALRMESLQRAAGQPGAPVIAAAETAGDLWLQIHRYEEARRTYVQASEQARLTPRTLAGLARVAARLNDTAAACAAFRQLLEIWGSRPALPAEIVEARMYLMEANCAVAAR
jgi:hypothetical protein